LYPCLVALFLLLGMTALVLVPLAPVLGLDGLAVAGWAASGTFVGIAVLALCMWPCASRAQQPVLSRMSRSHGLLCDWIYEVDEWDRFVASELGPKGEQRAATRALGGCLVFCIAPLLALIVTAMVALDGTSSVDFGATFAVVLPVSLSMMLVLAILKYARVRCQHHRALRPGSSRCVVFEHGVLFLGSLHLWGLQSCWLGSWALAGLKLEVPACTLMDADATPQTRPARDSVPRVLSFVLVATTGRDAGRQRHHVRVPVPRALSEGDVDALARQLHVPLAREQVGSRADHPHRAVSEHAPPGTE